MTALEDRLRTEMPELADALIARARVRDAEVPVPVDVAVDAVPVAGHGGLSRRQVLVGGAAAAAVATAAVVAARVGVFDSSREATRLDAVSEPTLPPTFGSWASMAAAPIAPRPFAVAGWTGSRTAFWAGSDLSRMVAYTDGALYDPATDSWSPMAVPGWGHPGLSSTVFQGALYTVAKGRATVIDPEVGRWRDLPAVAGMLLSSVVATGDAVWGLGPASVDRGGPPDIAIARYVPGEDRWLAGPIVRGSADQAAIVAGMRVLETAVVWSGDEVVVCGPDGSCVGFDPVVQTWRTVAAVADAVGPPIAVASDVGAVIVVPTRGSPSSVAVDVLSRDGWTRRAAGIPVEQFDTATAVAAGEWLVVFAKAQPPIVVDLRTGAWRADSSVPITGVQAPNAVWTGRQLVVWGGQPLGPTSPTGAVWTPPSR